VVITVRIAYILSQADHRKSPVQAWNRGTPPHLEPSSARRSVRRLRDDRLTLVLKPLDAQAPWSPWKPTSGHSYCDVYALPPERVRLDATTSCGYHTSPTRPDATRAQQGPSAADLAHSSSWPPSPSRRIVPGRGASIPATPPTTVVPPLVSRVRTMLVSRLLYAGRLQDGGAGDPRRDRANGDFYLTRLPLTGTVQVQFARGSRTPSSVTRPRS